KAWKKNKFESLQEYEISSMSTHRWRYYKIHLDIPISSALESNFLGRKVESCFETILRMNI
ncbi:hypothetical protein SFRURICE_002926, partial [Spodoptera frugiperda]